MSEIFPNVQLLHIFDLLARTLSLSSEPGFECQYILKEIDVGETALQDLNLIWNFKTQIAVRS